MSEKLLKISILLSVAVLAVWLYALANGGSTTVSLKSQRGKRMMRGRRRKFGERWQNQGVLGPMAVTSVYAMPPLAPVNP